MPDKNTDCTRRGFLAAAASCVVSAGLMGIPSGSGSAQETNAPENTKKDIIYRLLGRTKLKLPIVSMGVMNANNPEIVQASYQLGVRHFDTAASYQFGRNEQMVGNIIKRLGARDQVIIATKAHSPAQRQGLEPKKSKEKLINNVEASLSRLKTDYVDILYIHDVGDPETIRDKAIQEGITVLKEQKKIRFAGVSTHTRMADVINEMARTGFYDVVLTAINFTMADDAALLQSIADAAAKGIGIVAMKTLAGGGRWPNSESRRDYTSSTIAKAALKWVLRNENIATSIPGYTSYEHMLEDFSVAGDLEYTPEERRFLSDNDIKLGMGFCRQCRRCLASCPAGADIPTLMRVHMYAAQYGNFYHARATLNDMPPGSGLRACVSCAECTAKCVNTVDIPRRIDELKVIYA